MHHQCEGQQVFHVKRVSTLTSTNNASQTCDRYRGSVAVLQSTTRTCFPKNRRQKKKKSTSHRPKVHFPFFLPPFGTLPFPGLDPLGFPPLPALPFPPLPFPPLPRCSLRCMPRMSFFMRLSTTLKCPFTPDGRPTRPPELFLATTYVTSRFSSFPAPAFL